MVILPSFSMADCPNNNGAFCCSFIMAFTLYKCSPPISTSLIFTIITELTLPSAILEAPSPM